DGAAALKRVGGGLQQGVVRADTHSSRPEAHGTLVIPGADVFLYGVDHEVVAHAVGGEGNHAPVPPLRPRIHDVLVLDRAQQAPGLVDVLDAHARAPEEAETTVVPEQRGLEV